MTELGYVEINGELVMMQHDDHRLYAGIITNNGFAVQSEFSVEGYDSLTDALGAFVTKLESDIKEIEIEKTDDCL